MEPFCIEVDNTAVDINIRKQEVAWVMHISLVLLSDSGEEKNILKHEVKQKWVRCGQLYWLATAHAGCSSSPLDSLRRTVHKYGHTLHHAGQAVEGYLRLPDLTQLQQR